MINKSDLPSNDLLIRVVLYFAVVIALGMSFSFTLSLLNTAFTIGILGTLFNVCASFLFVRYVAAKHFTNPD